MYNRAVLLKKVMSAIKLAVIYYSQTGANYQLSQWAAEGARAAGAEVKLLRVPELAPEAQIQKKEGWKKHVEETQHVPEATMADLEWADAIIFSSPTRYGNIASQMKHFIDSTGGLWFAGKLMNKVVSAMSSAANPHGGQEATLLALYTSMHHWGAIIASPGYTDPVIFASGGNPYGTTATVDDSGNIKDADTIKTSVLHQAKRTVTVAQWVVAGKSAS